tara:strand:- start:1094 stop:3106 length:2013 start_codon:yes stop_codon:yes gene_type:complete
MAIKFLDDITLESNEIQDVAVENVSVDPTGFAGRIIYNTTTTTLKYYNGTAWVSLDGTGNVDSVTGSGGLLNAGTAVDVDIRPDYTTATNIIKSASGSGTLAATSTLIANVTNAVGEYTLTQIGAVVNGLLSGFTVIGNTGSESVEDGDTLAFIGGTYITTAVTEPTAGSTAVTFSHDDTTRSDSTSTSAPAAGGTITAVTSVTTTATGHLTAINVDTITLPVAGTMSSFDVNGDASGTTAQTITDGNTLQINGDGTYIDTLAVNTDILRVRHMTSGVTAAAYAYPTSVTVNAAGHITAITQGSAPGTMDSWTINYGATGGTTSSSISDGDSFTSRIYQTSYEGLYLNNPAARIQYVGLALDQITTATGWDNTNNFLVYADTGNAAGSRNRKILSTNVSLSEFGAPTADLSMGTNKVTNVVDPTNAQDAATKQYVDDSVVGGLVYQGGYNASTNTPALSGASNIELTKGWVYTVTVAGTFIGTAVEIGDVIIVEDDIAANSNPPVTDFTIVQRNVDLATNTVAGIASFPTANGFATMSSGAAQLSAGAAVSALGSASETVTITTDAFGKVTAATEQNIVIATSQVTSFDSSVDTLIEATQFKANIGNGSATSYVVNHALNTRDVIVQIYDNTTYETVQCKVIRTDVDNVTISTAAAAINAGLRVVIQSLQ